MNYFILRARTICGSKWYQFDIRDVPVLIDDDGTFILLGKKRSPKLSMTEVHYGDSEYGVFEGDIIKTADGREFLISYSAGFAAIDADGIKHNLYCIGDFEVICDYTQHPLGAKFQLNTVHQYKYRDIRFSMRDILCGSGGFLSIRQSDELIDLSEVRQSARMRIDNEKIFLGDIFDGERVTIAGGRVAVTSGSGYYDIRRKETMYGYHRRNSDRQGA